MINNLMYIELKTEYLQLIGEKELPVSLFEIVDIEDKFPVERISKLLNENSKYD